MIGIIVADKKELNKFNFNLIETKKINQFEFNIYDFYKKKLVVVNSGIGLVNAAAATQILISSFKIEKIYNYGAVGGDNSMQIFEIIIPKKIYFHDVLTPWYKRGEIPGEKKYFSNSFDVQMINNINLASGNSFVSNAEQLKNIQKDLNVKIFDMETAAIAQIAEKNNVKIKIVKCISDIIGENIIHLNNINKRIKKAGEKSFDKMIELLKNDD